MFKHHLHFFLELVNFGLKEEERYKERVNIRLKEEERYLV